MRVKSMVRFKKRIMALSLFLTVAMAPSAALAKQDVLVTYFSLDYLIPKDVDAVSSATRVEMDTAVVARKIAALAQADLVELRSTYAYPAVSYEKTKQIVQQYAHNQEKPLLERTDLSFSDYSTVCIGFPVWFHKAPPEIESFVKEHVRDLQGKKVMFFTTSGSTRPDEIIEGFKKLLPDVQILPTLSITMQNMDDDVKKLDNLRL